MSDHTAIQAWKDIITLSPWVPTGNLFPWDTWSQVKALAKKGEKNFDILPPLGFYSTIMTLKACFHPAARPPPTVGKEKVRDREKSKESENDQLARRVGEKETVKEQEKVMDQERSEESKSNQLTKRTGEKKTDKGED